MAVDGTIRFQRSRSIVIPVVEVMGTLFILSYGESSAVLSAPRNIKRCWNMTREDPLLLPICQKCGKYKGVGPCKNLACSESDGHITMDPEHHSIISCSKCAEERVGVCSKCGKGFCKTHGKGAESKRLDNFHQIVGTCVECNQVVCEDCWILNPNGDIVCLEHLEKGRKSEHLH